MDVRDIREMSDEVLLDTMEDKHEELFNLRFQQASGQLENTSTIRLVRRDLARLRTVQRQRALAAEVTKEEISDDE
jgi:large subunit ribosomal protein L29